MMNQLKLKICYKKIIFVIWITSVPSKIPYSITPLFFDEVSTYIKALPIGGFIVDLLSEVGLEVFVDLINFPIWQLIFFCYI